MRKVVVVGKGGLAREVKAMLDRINQVEKTWEFAGYVINDSEEPDVFGDDEKLILTEEKLDVIIALGCAELRKKLYLKYKKNLNLQFPSIIDPSVKMTDTVKMGKGNIFCPGSILTVNVEVGDFCLINMGCTIAHDCLLDDYVSVNPGCNLSGNVRIGCFTEVGTGSQIVQGITIGKEVDIWAGSVVIKSLADKCVVVGVPAKIIMHKD